MTRFKALSLATTTVAAAALLGLGLARAAGEAAAPPAAAASEFWAEEVARGLNVPWSMAWLPNGDMLILEKFGGLRMVRGGKLLPQVFPGAPPAYKVGPNGLLDMAVDPDFAKTGYVFITFDDGDESVSRPSLFRARFNGKALVDGQVIFRVQPESRVAPHPSLLRILFLPDKTMLLGSGVDDERRFRAQGLDTHLGKVLRLDRDGKAPADNPFVGKPGALPEIYAYGTRNPIGLVRDPDTGTIWEVENGPRGGDELNIIKPGANYGWPVATYGTEYNGKPITDVREAPGIESPITYWVPSIAPSGVALAPGKRYPQWKGDILAGALAGQHLRHVVIRDGKAVSQEVLLKDLGERIRDVRVGPDGHLYVLTDNADGRLLRLHAGKPAKAQQASVAQALAVKSNPTVQTLNLKPRPVDAARGQQLFAQRCSACHALQPGGPPRPGPPLAGIVGRPAGAAEHAYSAAMKASSVKWEPGMIDRFIAGPQAFLPGTSMAAPPVMQPQDRADIIAHLKQ